MGTKTFNNYEDLLTFTRASNGHALRPVSYGDELVTNGTFDSDLSDWTTGSNVTSAYSSGTAQLTLGGSLTSTANNWFHQEVFEAGKLYRVTFDATYVSGTIGTYGLQAGHGYTEDIRVKSSGTYTFTVDPTIGAGSQDLRNKLTFGGESTGVWKIDNVSVKEVSFDESDGTLTLFEHPNNVPRVEYDADGVRLGLLVEESRTNLVQYSTPDSNWSTSTLGTGVTPVVTLNNETSPDGTTTAAKVVLDVGGGTTSGDRSLFLVPSANVTATNSYAGSVWLKGETGGEQVVMRHAGNATYSLFTLTTSWARYDVTETAAGSLATMAIGLKGNQSDATATIYVWGAQIEAGSFPTSYIKTTGSTATRSAEVASIPVADFGYNQNEGTMFVEAEGNSDSTVFRRVLAFRNDSTTSQWEIMGDTAADVRMRHFNGSTVDVNSDVLTNVLDGETMFKMAYAIKDNDAAASGNGGTVVTDASVDFAIPQTLYIGSSGTGAYLCGHIKSIKYYPRRLTNAQLVDLTS